MFFNVGNIKYFFRFFKKEEHARSFIKNGQIYMNSASFFRRNEIRNEEGKFDFDEGVILKENDKAQLYWDKKRVGTITSVEYASMYNIYCLFTAFKDEVKIYNQRDSIIFDNRIINEFGLNVIMISAPHFLKRISEKLNGELFVMGPVVYKKLDDIERFKLLDNGVARLFCKNPEYSYQKETRLCIKAKNKGYPYIFELGNIEDIACYPIFNENNSSFS